MHLPRLQVRPNYMLQRDVLEEASKEVGGTDLPLPCATVHVHEDARAGCKNGAAAQYTTLALWQLRILPSFAIRYHTPLASA